MARGEWMHIISTSHAQQRCALRHIITSHAQLYAVMCLISHHYHYHYHMTQHYATMCPHASHHSTYLAPSPDSSPDSPLSILSPLACWQPYACDVRSSSYHPSHVRHSQRWTVVTCATTGGWTATCGCVGLWFSIDICCAVDVICLKQHACLPVVTWV